MNDEPMSAQTESWPRPHRLTVHDYYRMAEIGLLHPDDRTELIEGAIVDMPPIGDRHAAMVRALNKRLVRAVGDAAEVSTQLPVRLSLRSEPHDLQRDRVWRHRYPSRSGYGEDIEVESGTLPLPTLDADISLAELF
jgi:hypothetical protein